jgi:hypothetical protein
MPGEQKCDNCGKVNAEGEAYCYACGHVLPAGLAALKTHSLSEEGDLRPQIRWGTAYFGDHMLLRLRVNGTGEIIETLFERECVLGRAVRDLTPDLDLTPYRANDLGVSRRHAKLTRQSATIMVQDLGSVNGTFLNGIALLPFQPRVLRNEDELSLGRLLLRISFSRSPRNTA